MKNVTKGLNILKATYVMTSHVHTLFVTLPYPSQLHDLLLYSDKRI